MIILNKFFFRGIVILVEVVFVGNKGRRVVVFFLGGIVLVVLVNF